MWEALQGGFEHASKFTSNLLKTQVYQVASGLRNASLLCYRQYRVDCRKRIGFGV